MPHETPIIDERGFDQYGIGPLARRDQMQRGTWPQPPRKPKPYHVPLSVYGDDSPKAVAASRGIGAGDALELVDREVEKRLDPARKAYSDLRSELQEMVQTVIALADTVTSLQSRVEYLEMRLEQTTKHS